MEALDPIFTLLRVVVALGAVLVLIWFFGRRLAKRNHALTKGRIRTVARHGMGTRQSVQVIDIDTKRYVLGVAEQNVSVLDSYDVPEDELPADPPLEGEVQTDSFAEHLSAAQTPVAGASPISGSILSAQTWKQAYAALRKGPQR